MHSQRRCFGQKMPPLALYLVYLWSNSDWLLTAFSSAAFIKVGPTPASFGLFASFHPENLGSQKDLNSDRQGRRQERWPLDHHHGPKGSAAFAWTGGGGGQVKNIAQVSIPNILLPYIISRPDLPFVIAVCCIETQWICLIRTKRFGRTNFKLAYSVASSNARKTLPVSCCA